MKRIKIGVVVGSLRRASYSKGIADALVALMPEDFEMQTLEIGALEMFNQDIDDDGATSAEWTAFRKSVGEMDGYLFVTPEYNRSVPPVLKNALDIASRPYGQNMWDGKPGAVVSVSPGKLGGFGANHHLRQTLSFLNIYTMQQPESYVGGAADMLDAGGQIADDGTRRFLKGIADGFAAWVRRFV